MTSDKRPSIITDVNSQTDNDGIIPDVSFLDGLHSDTQKLVALIMAESSGQKNIFQQLKLDASI